MTTDGWVLRVVGAWTLAALMLVGGLAFVAAAVESGRLGPASALWVAVLSMPQVLVPLAPLVCAVGAGLAAARLDARGERVGLEAVGLGPLRTARSALLVGLVVGLGQWAAAGHLVYRAEAARRVLIGAAVPEWVWLEDGAARPSDGTRVWVDGGRILDVRPTMPLDEDALATARMRQEPHIASAAALRQSSLPTARLERLVRTVRIVACGGLSVLGWLPLGPRPSTQVGRVLAIGLVWVALDMVLQAMAAQGQAPTWLGGAGATALLWVGLVAYRTCSQKPV